MKIKLKKCVILYSRRHFDPHFETELNASSAGRIASSIYSAVSSLEEFETHYFDSFNHNEWAPVEADVLISLIDNLSLAKWYFKPKKIIVIAVNQHPLARLLINMRAMKDRIPPTALVAADGIYQPFWGLKESDTIICIGNSKTAESFHQYLSNCKVIQASYKDTFSDRNYEREVGANQIENVLILMSSIGYRKGFDRVYEALEREHRQLSRFRFHILGHPEGDYWKERIDFLVNTQSNVIFHGWLSNKSDEFQTLLDKMHVAVFPTREEGLVGSLLECISVGIVCLHTEFSGLNNNIDLLHLSSHGPLMLSQKFEALEKLQDNDLNSLRDLQVMELRKQFSENLEISVRVVETLQAVDSTQSARHRWVTIAKALAQLPFFRANLILLRRIQFTYIRIGKAKMQLRFPGPYQFLKKVRAFPQF